MCLHACVGQRGKGKSAEQRVSKLQGAGGCAYMCTCWAVIMCFLGVKMRKMCKKFQRCAVYEDESLNVLELLVTAERERD